MILETPEQEVVPAGLIMQSGEDPSPKILSLGLQLTYPAEATKTTNTKKLLILKINFGSIK